MADSSGSNLRTEFLDACKKHLISAAAAALIALISWGGLLLAKAYLPPEAQDQATHTLTLMSFATWFNAFAHAHPKRVTAFFLFVLVIGGLGAILFLLFRAIFVRLVTLYDSFNLGKVLGAAGYWPDATSAGGLKAWTTLSRYALRTNNPILLVLGATGISTFGKNYPLHDIIAKFDGEVRILLMDPRSPHLPARALSVNQKEADYRNEIGRALSQIEDWQKAGRNVHFRMYDSVPNWKLILTKDVAWVQYYKTGTHVDGTPVYHFYATVARTGLYHLFLAEYHRIWKLCDPALAKGHGT